MTTAVFLKKNPHCPHCTDENVEEGEVASFAHGDDKSCPSFDPLYSQNLKGHLAQLLRPTLTQPRSSQTLRRTPGVEGWDQRVLWPGGACHALLGLLALVGQAQPKLLCGFWAGKGQVVVSLISGGDSRREVIRG